MSDEKELGFAAKWGGPAGAAIGIAIYNGKGEHLPTDWVAMLILFVGICCFAFIFWFFNRKPQSPDNTE